MKTKCTTNFSGYEHSLTVGQEYEIKDICEGIFSGDYYISVDIGEGKTATAYNWRFDMTKEQCQKYIKNLDKS